MHNEFLVVGVIALCQSLDEFDSNFSLELLLLDIAKLVRSQEQETILFHSEPVVLLYFAREDNVLLLLQFGHDHFVMLQLQVVVSNGNGSLSS